MKTGVHSNVPPPKKKQENKMNSNRIVRIQNDEIHDTVHYVSILTGKPYQTVFNELCEYLIEGHVIGEETNRVLIERVLRKGKRIR